MAKNRNTNIHIRCTEKEKEYLLQQAKLAGMSLTDYLIHISKNGLVVVIDELPNLLIEITKIGTNVNQIARIANQTQKISKESLNAVISMLCDIKMLLHQFVNDVVNEKKKAVIKKEITTDEIASRLSNIEKLLKESTDNNGSQ